MKKPRRRRVSIAKILGLMLLVAVGIGGVAVWSIPMVSKPIKGFFTGGNTGVITFTVRSGSLPISVDARGSLESSKNVDVYCNVEGGTTIIRIVPEGTKVKKGDLLCELDSAALKDQLTNQVITVKSAEASFKNATLTREVAEIAVKEYKEGVYVQDKQTAQGEIKLAESDLVRAEDRLDWAERMFIKGYVSKATRESEKLNLEKAKFTYEQAQSKLKVLEEYTKEKTIKELESEVKKALSDELAKRATWELEKSKEDKLEKQIAYCTLTAPIDGLVVYANDPSRMFGSNQSQIEEGATVRERQKVISIPDIGRMQVNAKVHESQIDKIKPQLRAQVRVDSFADRQLDGVVYEVSALPDAGNFFSSDIKVYTTRIQIQNPMDGLRPGMSSEVKILVDQIDNVLSVPVQAVIEYNGQHHVTKKIGDQYQQSVVTIGPSNEKFIQITKGLAEGDEVVLNPISLMSEEEKREAFRNAKDAKQEWGKGEGEPGKGGPPGAAGKGAPGKGDPKAAAKKKGGRGGPGGAMRGIFQKMSPEDRAKMKTASPEEKEQILRKAGATDQQLEMMRNFGGGGGFPGGGGGGFGGGRGGPGGGPPGGGNQ